MTIVANTFVPALPLNESTFRLLRDAIQARMGVHYADNQRELLALKLSPRVLERGFSNFLDYYYHLTYDPEGEEEWKEVFATLAVNETYFWREFDQIRAAAERLVPAWQTQRPGQKVRIWHAACASGEEPYSMVIALLERGRFLHGPIEILASDINHQALEKARRGVYRPSSFRALPEELQRKYFTPLPDNTFQLRETVRRRVQLFPLNLIEEKAVCALKEMDIIFCRNTFIYFNQETIARIVDWFYRILNPGGYLFLGAAESLLKIPHRFELDTQHGAIGYRKPPGG